jgi:6-phosphogluconolactonase (cycloisomerase 2 family)
VANQAWFASNISAYSIDGTTGALTPVAGSPFSVGDSPASVTVHPTGQFAYVANCGAPCGGFSNIGSLSAFSLDRKTGALTPIAGSPFPTDGYGPLSLMVHPTGQFVYVGNWDGSVSAYSIDGTTGALTPVAGSPFLTGMAVTVDPTGRFVYVANFSVSAYSIDGTTGALTPVAGSPFPAGPYTESVTVDPTGQFVYVANQDWSGSNFGNVSAYSIDGTMGALTQVAGSPFLAGVIPWSMTTTAGRRPPATVAKK